MKNVPYRPGNIPEIAANELRQVFAAVLSGICCGIDSRPQKSKGLPGPYAGNSGRAYRKSFPPDPMEIAQPQFVDKLQKKMAAIDFKTVAPLIGARVKNDRIIISSLGKDFIFDHRGNMESE